MPLSRVIPTLADLTQDIAGLLPVTLLHAWAAGSQDVEAARALLHGFRIEGAVVANDTSGLSRMIEGRDLLDVLALISTPKSIIHAVGAAVGGVGVGTWVADNTEMYYPPARGGGCAARCGRRNAGAHQRVVSGRRRHGSTTASATTSAAACTDMTLTRSRC